MSLFTGTIPMTAASPLRRSLDPMAASLGLVFTDSRGRVVFGDSHFLDLIGPDKAGTLVGKPLHQIMGADHQDVSSLISDIGRAGYVRDKRLSVTIQRGEQQIVACSGIATYDEQGGFIGVDLTLRDPDHTAHPDLMLDTHGDVLNARIQQIEFEAETHGVEQNMALANLYFTAQVSALQVLLGRMGGPRVAEALEDQINGSAAKRQWPIQIKGGRFVVELTKTPPEAFRLLMAELFEFASGVIGQRGVVEEMKLIDVHMKPETQAVAGQVGLRDFLG